MAVYRKSTSPWRKRLPLVAAVAVILVLIVIGALVINHNGNKAADPKAALNNALDTLSQSIDLFDIEYAKIVAKTPASQTGAPGAIQRARDTLSAAQSTIHAANSAAFEHLQIDLNAMGAAVNAASSPDLSVQIADANQQIQVLRGSSSTP